ncbi:tryptophan-rich sensory protein [Streptomyces sp. LP05-1]|uniref:Tryptophan-rich sensory protein n=1 Tax=Streptomyces pyxinae TaxID=2970734 RepID=A0ABT2CB02_9ACTN|nr:TspO/MBR family protein [Streptomyces sp. LP05-1]MCS0634595.1 tryptophan-rich sensory protein [Streptomyces sp. LP05-1]
MAVRRRAGRPGVPGAHRAREAYRTYAAGAVAVAASAVAGARAVDPDSDWYRSLDKPPWQPPPPVFGLVWTPLYASIAWAAGHALLRARPPGERRSLGAALAVNLALDTAWNHLFFGRRSIRAGLLGTLLLDLSNVQLIRRTARSDRTAARALVPYALWCAFATALNADLAARNRAGARTRATCGRVS